MNTADIVMLVGGAIALVLGVVELLRTDWQSLPAYGVAVLGAVFVALVLLPSNGR